MTYTDPNASYALNSYVWKLLQANLDFVKSDYDGAVPIIPSAQQPELMRSGKPFLVYGSALRPAQHLYALREESIGYNIYGPTSTETNRVVSLLASAFERQDEAAGNVNQWLDTEAKPENRNRSRGVSFATIRLVMSERAEPADQEGGWVSGFVLLETKYIVTNPDPILNNFSYDG